MTKRYVQGSTLRVDTDKPMRRFNPEKRARRAAEDLVYGTHHAWIKRQPCEFRDHPAHRCGFYRDRPKIEGHHLKTVGSGGQDRENEIPCCPVGHDESEAAGNVSSQCDLWGRDLRSIACEYTARFDAEYGNEEQAE